MKTLIVTLALASVAAHASFIDPKAIDYTKLSAGEPQISEEVFAARLRELQTVYAPIVKELGGRLDLKGNWRNDKIVARATQMFGAWKVEFSGGLARRPELTADGMSLIICH